MSKKYVISDGVIICWDDVSKADNMGLSPHDIRKKYGITLEDYTKQIEDKARKEGEMRLSFAVFDFLKSQIPHFTSTSLYKRWRGFTSEYLKDSKEDKVKKDLQDIGLDTGELDMDRVMEEGIKEDKVSKSPVTFTSDESFTPHPLGNPDLHSTEDKCKHNLNPSIVDSKSGDMLVGKCMKCGELVKGR